MANVRMPIPLVAGTREQDRLDKRARLFPETLKACAGHRKGRPAGLTWVTPQTMRLYAKLFDMGHAHSFEVWSAGGGPPARRGARPRPSARSATVTL